jgi:hypothetical protein
MDASPAPNASTASAPAASAVPKVSLADRIDTVGINEASKPISPRQRPKSFIAPSGPPLSPFYMANLDVNHQSVPIKQDGVPEGIWPRHIPQNVVLYFSFAQLCVGAWVRRNALLGTNKPLMKTCFEGVETVWDSFWYLD